MNYQPPASILNAYANLLVNFALGKGTGIKPGEVVQVQIPEGAKPLFAPLRDAILRAGGHPFMQLLPDGVDVAGMYAIASDEQLAFFPAAYYKGMAEQFDHRIRILAEADKYELATVPPEKIMRTANAIEPYRRWINEKEAAGNYSWTIAMYGTPAMAADAGMTEEEYWQEIIAACYLDAPDPIAEWKRVQDELERVRLALNDLHIEELTVEGEGIDLTVGVGEGRQWLGGGGMNIPSFELFISPDWRRTEGTIRFNQPLYYAGNRLEGIALRFEKGHVVEATAAKGQELLREMIASKNADRIGEFSLTDGRLSRITKPMGETLFDENMGGPEGNTHLAVGNAYQDSYPGDPSTLTQEDWERLGYNQSPVHTDIISTERRKVTAILPDGSRRVIYENGRFTI